MNVKTLLAAVIGLLLAFFVFDRSFGPFGARAMAGDTEAQSRGTDVAQKATAPNQPETENHPARSCRSQPGS